MLKFSQAFGINLTQAQLDFVDISPDFDTPLFIDPYAISIRGDDWSSKCQDHITNFFEKALSLIRSGKKESARMLLNGLSEPNETCLGLSKGPPSGRGVSGKQALDLYHALSVSSAAKTGLLQDLADCDLFVDGIGSDKISDITTNIIRRLLIQYTIDQCNLHGIPLVGKYPSGRFWDIDRGEWLNDFVELPVLNGKKIILVPKFSVRRKMSIDSHEFYNHHVLNFIQEEHLSSSSSLVRVLRNGEIRPPTKKILKDRFPFSKEFIAQFSEKNPEILDSYKKLYEKMDREGGVLPSGMLDENFHEPSFAEALIEKLKNIPAGNNHANEYHEFMIGVLEFIFYPNLIYPKKEFPIHNSRKRIDITYTNSATGGFFQRVHSSHQIASSLIMVECKNYSSDPANPEIDQLSGRFSVNRGKLGILCYRDVSNRKMLLSRCRDTAADGRGFILPLGDAEIVELLELIMKRARRAIDQRLEAMLDNLRS